MIKVWKLQWPLYANTRNPPVMAYRKGRKGVRYVPCTDQLAALFGDADKIFVEAYIEAGTLVIERVVRDQNW